jgi:hypothetical protein
MHNTAFLSWKTQVYCLFYVTIFRLRNTRFHFSKAEEYDSELSRSDAETTQMV